MQVDLGIVVTVIGGVFAVFMGLSKYALTSKEKELERQFSDLLKACNKQGDELDNLKKQFHTQQLTVKEMEGDLKLARLTNVTIEKDVEEIKSTMVRRQEWDTRMEALEKMMHEVQTDIRRLLPGSRYPSTQYPGSISPKKDP